MWEEYFVEQQVILTSLLNQLELEELTTNIANISTKKMVIATLFN